ncbi:MAG: Cupin 4 family protein [Frankiales bacterium]|nr:Cupin 4 family protein [Frankiales bacterium]
MTDQRRAPLPPSGAGALARCTAVPPDAFAAEHWSRTPLLTRAKELPRDFTDLLSADDVDELVGERALREPFFRTVREGGGLPLPVRTVTAGARRIGDLVDSARLAAQHEQGATLVLQSLHRMHPPVGRFCRALGAELGHATQCNAYVTPAGDAQGFDFHHDTHDVFVLQVSGRKRWIVHEPVLPLPLPSQARSGADLVPEGAEPLFDVELEAGDCLYLPRGYVHAALTTDEHSVHLTVGVLATTWFDVLTDALTLAKDQLAFRDALPVQPRGHLAGSLPDLLRSAALFFEDLDPAVLADVVDRRLAGAVPPEPVRLLAGAAALSSLSPATQVRPRLGTGAVLEGASVRLRDRIVAFPDSCAAALARALEAPASVADLALGGLDEDDAVVLARRLLREGVLLPA